MRWVQNCILYGYYGDDEFIVKNMDFIIKDFRKERIIKHQEPEKDSDKLLLKDFVGHQVFFDEQNNATYLILSIDNLLNKYSTTITLEGVSEGAVKEWLEIARYPKNYDKTTIDENPIKIE